jgi:tellurite resistance protein TerC
VLEISGLTWGVTIALVLGLLAVDLVLAAMRPHKVGFKEALAWSLFYIGVAIAFGIWFAAAYGGDAGTQYFAGWIVEKSLSVDNLFVFVIIMTTFAVPEEHQHKVLTFGIVLALIMRAIFIGVGAAAINEFSWIFYIFGAFLIWTAVKLAKEGSEDDGEYEENRLIKWVETHLPATDRWHGTKIFVRENGKRLITPMFLVILALGTTDLLFALDSIPAIYGLTQEPYLVLTANIFALMGLRQLYFLIGGLLQRLVYLSYGLAVLLGFIGIKLVLHAMHENELPFVNGGEHISWAPDISILFSLGVIVGVLAVTTVASLTASARRTAGEDAGQEAPPEAGRVSGPNAPRPPH